MKERNQGNPPAGATEWSEESKFCTMMEFEQLFYDSGASTWKTLTWMGVPVHKNPCDLWMYQQLIFKVKPDLIIETGTLYGGSALYLAHLCDLIGKGSVVSIDVNEPLARIKHDRIDFFNSDSIDPDLVDRLQLLIRYRRARTVMVILDSDHECSHVRRELELYHQFVTPGSYLIIEDMNLNGHPVWPTYGNGPKEAVQDFLLAHPEFERDVECERFLLTFNRGGFLRKVEDNA